MNEKTLTQKLCSHLGYSKELLNYYVKNKAHVVDDLDEAIKLIQTAPGMSEEVLERAIDDFRTSNWKVRKGDRISNHVLELAEHILLFCEDIKRTKTELDKGGLSWRAQMLNSGFEPEQLDEVMYKFESKRDKKWGSYCT
tara:strand:- start:916 stop:1335 length:420 start_codon:yes stop_codon:yes gene_type:complete